MKDKNKLSGKRILIVDDEPDILETLEEIYITPPSSAKSLLPGGNIGLVGLGDEEFQ